MSYDGPLRDEPLAIELHNTIYATSAGVVDALAGDASSGAWLRALAPRLPVCDLPAGALPEASELVALRTAVRAALHAAVAGDAPDPRDVETINRASRRAPQSLVVRWSSSDAPPRRGTDFQRASRADVIVAALAADAIELLTSSRRDALRTCAAPGCVLMFLKEHPRREWCSDACGNRARQARHYERTRRGGPR
jgi:predicted RNA-binding Zn ribbon-like protein